MAISILPPTLVSVAVLPKVASPIVLFVKEKFPPIIPPLLKATVGPAPGLLIDRLPS
jgi:hypothetical protein